MSVWEDLLEYLSSNRDLSLGLTAGKMLGRAYDIEETEDCITFKMERHRGILGSMYTPGARMPAFRTRIEEYKYCKTTNELDSFEIEELPFDISSIDYEGLASDYFSVFLFFIEEQEDGSLLLKESSCNDEWPIESLEDALAKIPELIDNVDFELLDPVNELGLDEEGQAMILAKFKDGARTSLARMMEDIWDYR